MTRAQARTAALAVVAFALFGCESTDSGANGNAGVGAAGASGTSGVSGAAGAGGTSGASGTAGAGGTSGVSGAGGAGTAGAGTAGTAGAAGGATFAPTYQAVFTEILANSSAGNCMFGGCHGGPPDPIANGNLQLFRTDAAATYAALVNVASTSSACMDMPLVSPGNAAASLLALKLRPNPPCGMQMPIPPLGDLLSEAQIEQIETWIDNGAMND